MSNLQPGLITLDKGLDLQTPKIVANPGTLLDSLNYEQVDFQGQKRIDGYARYDGSLLSSVDDFWIIDTDTTLESSTSGYVATYNDTLWGIVVKAEGIRIHVVPIDHTIIPSEGGTIAFEAGRISDNNSLEGTEVTVVSAWLSHEETVLTEQEQYDALLEASAAMREYITYLPGAVIGLHWFRDRLYAIADVAVVRVPDITTYPNSTVTLTYANGDTEVVNVLDVYYLASSSVLFLDSKYNASNISYVDGVAVQTVTSIPDGTRMIASFFESRTEEQVLEEDASYTGSYGWKFNHLGWVVNFEKGSSAYGELVSANQHREDVGTEGPTGTDDQAGSPSTLVQGVTITNTPAQVNGWKSSGDTEDYDLNVNDIYYDDASYEYGDAFISWDSAGVITSQGSSMEGLIQYPADATIVVEDLDN